MSTLLFTSRNADDVEHRSSRSSAAVAEVPSFLISVCVDGKMSRRCAVSNCFVYLLTVLLVISYTTPLKAESAVFRAVASGIQYAAFDVRPGDSDPFSGHAVRIDLERVDIRLVAAGPPSSRRTVEEIVAPHAEVVAINASFFDAEGRAMGLAGGEGRFASSRKLLSWGALVIDDTNARVVLGRDIYDYGAYRVIVQGIPRLVIGGKVNQLKPQIAERTAVCATGSIVLFVVATKAEATAFARFLAEPPDKGGLGCGDALNLDGGPSTQLVVKLPSLTLSVAGGWGVPNALVFVPGKATGTQKR